MLVGPADTQLRILQCPYLFLVRHFTHITSQRILDLHVVGPTGRVMMGQ